jgi:hypothetical protein
VELATLVTLVSPWAWQSIKPDRIDVEGEESFVGEAGIPASDYSSGDGCVNQGPDGLGSVFISPSYNLRTVLGFWAVEENYCVLAYKQNNCVTKIDKKVDWKRGHGVSWVEKLQVLRLTASDDPLVPLEDMSSVKVVKVGCHFLTFRNRCWPHRECVMQFDPVSGHEFVLVSEQAFVEQIAENVAVDMQAC